MVYTQYPTTTGLIHDSWDLGIIYEKISLAGDDLSPGGPACEQLIRAAKEKYRRILLDLAAGRGPADPEQQRVAALFGPGVKPEVLLAAADNIRFQRCMKDRFQSGLVRSGRYLGAIKEIFKSHGLPDDLAYLPHVESSFDYQAYSKSGAVGIWQLIKATGSRFLTINATLDERRDPILASQAAAKFLRGNHKNLESWPLALTAYNHGPASMLRAKNSLGSFDRIYQAYDHKSFGFASRNFYAEFLAAREIAKNYRAYFPDLRLEAPVATRTFTVNRAAPVNVLTRHVQVDSTTLAALNPALLPPVWSGQRAVPKGYRLYLPKEAGAKTAIAPLPPEPAPARVVVKTAASHRVKRGETISAIARRYGVTPRALLASNQLGQRAVITAGQQLRIPMAERSGAKVKVRAGGKGGKEQS
jgi:membrane-bound lytic murein transglycosylase D